MDNAFDSELRRKLVAAGDQCVAEGWFEDAIPAYRAAIATDQLRAIGDQCMATAAALRDQDLADRHLVVACQARDATGQEVGPRDIAALVAIGDRFSAQQVFHMAIPAYLAARDRKRLVALGDRSAACGFPEYAVEAYLAALDCVG